MSTIIVQEQQQQQRNHLQSFIPLQPIRHAPRPLYFISFLLSGHKILYDFRERLQQPQQQQSTWFRDEKD